MLERVARPAPAPSPSKAAGRRSRRKLQEVAFAVRSFAPVRSKKQTSAMVVEPPLQSTPSTRQSGRSGGAAAPPEHTEWYGRCRRAEKSCTSREAACEAALALACGRCVCVCLATAQRSWSARARSVHAYRYRAVSERSEARYREDARPRYRAVGPHGKRTIRESIPRGIEFPLSVYRGSLWTREGHIDPTTS